MTTKQDWDKREDLRMGLSKLLNESPLKEALEVCLSLDVDNPQTMSGQNDLLHQAALNGVAREGYFRFLRNLKALSRDPVERKELSAPWTYAARQYQAADE